MTDQGGASFATHPAVSAWRHRDASDGFEVLRIAASGAGLRLQGTTAAVEDGQAWVVDYDIEIDAHWLTRAAQVDVRSDLGPRSVRLTADGMGHWLVDGEVAPWLDGCLDVDVEASAATNALPVHRLALTRDRRAPAPAAYVRAADAEVERLEQTYVRLPDDGDRQRYDYSSPRFDYQGILIYDRFGFVIDYPGIAERVL